MRRSIYKFTTYNVVAVADRDWTVEIKSVLVYTVSLLWIDNFGTAQNYPVGVMEYVSYVCQCILIVVCLSVSLRSTRGSMI